MNRTRRGPRLALTAVPAALVLHLGAVSAWAQVPARLPGEDGGMMQWIVAAAIVVLCGVTAFINPKRSHRS